MKRSFCVLASVLLLAGSASIFGQNPPPPGPPDGPGMPDEMGMGGPGGFDPNNPPVEPIKPVKPVAPKKLELGMGWMAEREQMKRLYDGMVQAQFSGNKSAQSNPFSQMFREYFSEKFIVSEWGKKNPVSGYGWTYPVPEVTESKEEIDRAVTEELEHEAMEKFPDKEYGEYLNEAEEKYQMFKKGDKVKIQLLNGRGGRGVANMYEGRIRNIEKYSINLEPRRIIQRIDLPDEVRARFFPEDHKKMVKKYADEAAERVQQQRVQYVYSQRLTRMPERLSAANYVPNHMDFPQEVTLKIFKLDYWIARRELVTKMQRDLWMRNIGENKLGDRTFKAYMQRRGFRDITKEESMHLGQALRSDEENHYIGWVPLRDVLAMQKWIADYNAYLEAMKKYDEDIKKYDEAMIAYAEAKKDFDQKLKEYNEKNGISEEEE